LSGLEGLLGFLGEAGEVHTLVSTYQLL
jgi:hypothetical protein